MSSTTTALKSSVTSSESILPTLTPATLTSSPGIDEAGVVEDRAHLVGLLAAVAREQHDGDRDGDHEQDGDEDAHQGPGSTRLGSQSSGPRLPLSVYGAELSGGPLAGGARAALEHAGLAAPSMRSDGGIGVSTPPAGLSVNVERVEDRLDAREVAVGVVVGGALAEVAQPADEVRRVRADELEHRLRALERRRGPPGRPASRPAAATASCASPRRGRCRGRRGGSACCRSRIVGRASRTSGRSSRRNGARSLVAGLDSATSTSRSSSVARRFTNVVLARRSVVGSSSSARESATFSAAIAPAVAFALLTRPERSSRRSATAVTALRGVHEEAGQRALVLGDLVGEHARGRQQRVEVLGRLADLLALALVLRRRSP